MARRAALLATIALLLTGACSEDRRSPTAAELRDGDATADHVISIDADGFDPAELNVAPGDIIEVVNDGDQAHSLSSAAGVDTGAMEPGESVTMILREPGEIEITDRIGATGNEGRIVVSRAP